MINVAFGAEQSSFCSHEINISIGAQISFFSTAQISTHCVELHSGTGTNLKVGVQRPKIFLSCPSPVFGCTSTISRFGERFRDDQYSLVSFLFSVLLLKVPPPVPSHM